MKKGKTIQSKQINESEEEQMLKKIQLMRNQLTQQTEKMRNLQIKYKEQLELTELQNRYIHNKKVIRKKELELASLQNKLVEINPNVYHFEQRSIEQNNQNNPIETTNQIISLEESNGLIYALDKNQNKY